MNPKEDFIEETKALYRELIDIPCGVYRIGWTAVIPSVPLIGLAILIIWTLTK